MAGPSKIPRWWKFMNTPRPNPQLSAACRCLLAYRDLSAAAHSESRAAITVTISTGGDRSTTHSISRIRAISTSFSPSSSTSSPPRTSTKPSYIPTRSLSKACSSTRTREEMLREKEAQRRWIASAMLRRIYGSQKQRRVSGGDENEQWVYKKSCLSTAVPMVYQS